MSVQLDLEKTRLTALEELGAATAAVDLDRWKSRWLGKKSPVEDLMQRLRELPKEEKPEFGQKVNRLKQELTAAYEEARATRGASRPGGAPAIDVTVPGLPPRLGTFHPIQQMIDQMVGCMRSLGFEVAEGPEIEDEFHNFIALNIPEDHVARSEGDNFYLADGKHLLRSQTSTVQIRVMEKRRPPLRIIAPGRVYRPDTVDATHHYMFHQLEGLAVDQGLTMADLKATLTLFFSGLFVESIELRLRPSFFPFTEPSAEVDARCPFCKGKGCPTCKQSGWIEMGGCGMVDPNVFRAVGLDPEVYTGFAFGLGVERLAMRQFAIPDIRFLTENDVRFLRQFS